MNAAITSIVFHFFPKNNTIMSYSIQITGKKSQQSNHTFKTKMFHSILIFGNRFVKKSLLFFKTIFSFITKPHPPIIGNVFPISYYDHMNVYMVTMTTQNYICANILSVIKMLQYKENAFPTHSMIKLDCCDFRLVHLL